MIKKIKIIIGLSIFLLSCIVLFFIRLTYFESFVTKRWYSSHDKPNILEVPYTMDISHLSEQSKVLKPTLFTQGDFKNFIEWVNYNQYSSFFDIATHELYQSSREQIVQRRVSNQSLFQHYKLGDQKIPNIIHSFWFQEHFSIASLPQWRNYFEQHSKFKIVCWFFNQIPQHVQKAFSGLDNIFYLDIVAYDTVQYAADLLYYQYKKIQPWMELIAYNLIYKYGGIYVDVTTDYIPMIITPELLYLDYFSSQDKGIITTILLAGKPKSIVYHQHLLLLEDLYRYKPLIRSMNLSSEWLNPWSSSLGITLAMDQWLTTREVFLPLKQSEQSEQLWKRGLIENDKTDKIDKIDYTFTRKQIPKRGFYSGPYSDHRMVERYGVNIFKHFASIDGISIDQYNTNRQRIEETFYKNIYTIQQSNQEKIPQIIHRIWLTKGRDLSIQQVWNIKKTYNLLHPHWKFILWTNNISAISQTIDILKRECPGLEIQDIHQYDLLKGVRIRNIFNAFMEDNRFAHAKDILAANIIYSFGGLCIDLGMDIQRDFTDLIKNYDLVFWYYFSSDINNIPDQYDAHIEIPIIGGKKNSDLFQKWLDDLDTAKYKRYNKTYFSNPMNQLVFTATEYLSYLLNAYFSHNRVLFLPDHFYVKLGSHSNTWIEYIQKSKIDLWNF